MKKLNTNLFSTVFALTLLLLGTQSVCAQTFFSENFNSGTIPGTFTLYNVDNLTVEPQVAIDGFTFGSNAWIGASAAPTIGDTAAYSTSWYSPIGTSNDWMVTPAIVLNSNTGTTLSWRGKSYGGTSYLENYEVRIATTNSVAAFNAGTQLFITPTAGEPDTWTTHSVSLAAFVNQTIYIAFHNISLDKYVMAIDDILVKAGSNDIGITAATNPSEYTSIPLTQAASGTFSVGTTVSNIGGNNATGVAVNLRVTNLTTAVVVNNQTLTGATTLAGGANANYTGTAVAYAGLGLYEFRYICSMTPVDANRANDTVRRYVVIDPSLYARDNTILFGTLTNALGVQGGVVEVAQKFTVNNTTGVTLDTVFAYFNEKRVGARYRAKIYLASGGIPGTLGATSLTYTTTPADTFGGANGLIGLVFSPALAPPLVGDYFVSVEQMDTFNFGLGYNAAVATAGAAQLQINGAAWTASSGAGFPGAYVIWPHLKSANSCNLAASATGTNPTCGLSNGGVTSSVTGATSTPTYAWSTGATTANITMRAPGTYTVTVTSAACTATATATLTNVGTPPNVTVSTTLSSCTSSTGTATVNGAAGGSTYVWSTTPVQNSATATALSAGSYTVTVTTTGCSATASGSVTNSAPPTFTTSSTQSTCNGNTGSATVSGAPSGSSYAWSTSPVQNTATASNIAGGTYTVTVTNNGCSATASVTVSTPAPPTFTTSSTQSNCNGNTGSASVSGAPGGSSYAWSTSPVQNTATATNLAGGSYTVTVTSNGCSATASVTVSTPAPPTFTTSSTQSTCAGATGTATATGAPGGSSYAWSTSPMQNTATATNLAAGSYTVTVTSNGCTASASVVVSNPNAPVASATGTNPLCFGGTGSAIASATGGTGAYSYLWSTSPAQTTINASNLLAGTYTVTIKDVNLCAGVASVTISSPSQIMTTTSNTSVNCFGGNTGTATVTATGGTGTLAYTWNSAPAQGTATAINLSAGTYTVTVRDAAQCTVTATTTVSQPASALSGNISKTDVPCFGAANGSATAVGLGGTPNYGYAWSNGQNTAATSPLAPGNFTVTITDSKGCTATASTTISQPNAALAVSTSTSGTTSIATVTGGTNPYSYSWNTNPTQTNATATGLTPGTYSVTVTDAKGCTVSGSVTISSIKDIAAIGYTTLEVYPNPSNGLFTIKAAFEKATDLTIAVYDVNGKAVENSNLGNATSFEYSLNITGLASGIYTLRLQSAKGITTQKLIIK